VRPPPATVNPKPPRADQRRRLERLRAELARLDRRAPDARGVRPLGLAGIDLVLPGGGLPRGALHELHGELGQAAALGFAIALLGRLLAAGGHGLWIGPRDDLFGPGLAELGLPPERLLVVRARARAARLWALEEALRSPGLVAALAEVDRLSLIQSRRLQLAAETRGVCALLLRPLAAGASPSVALTRWRIAPLAGAGPVGWRPGSLDQTDLRGRSWDPSETSGGRPLAWFPGPPAVGGPERRAPTALGPPRWQVELIRCRGGRTGRWQVEWRQGGWHEVADPVLMAADALDRPAAAAHSAG
jgi:protein ImuA